MEEFKSLLETLEPLQVTDSSPLTLVPSKKKSKLPLIALPFGPPPILPDLEKELDSLVSDFRSLPLYHLDRLQIIPERTTDIQAFYGLPSPPTQSELQVVRDPSTLQIVDYRMVKTVSTPSGVAQLSETPPSLATLLHKTPTFESDNTALNKIIPRIGEGMDLLSSKSVDQVQLTDIFTACEDEDLLTDAPEDIQYGEHQAGDTPQVQKEVVDEDVDHELSAEAKKLLQTTLETPVLEISKAKPLQTTEHHQWAVILDSVEPMNNFHEKVPVMAMEWDFELDTFQKKAIACLDSGESVFVAAHTSAGKTVIAEYAIALSRKHVSKAIYTSPIKALSNQKYRDFCMRFSDIGILTGDVKINPDASCLIMTTEILRSMLYNNSKSLKDLEWVIFDEVHYVNNVERGVVWEEVLIMLPDHVNLVLLSATAPNYVKFANWIGKIKKRKIFVINTLKRPVPLEHYLYIGQGGKHKPQQYLILDSSGRFLKSNYAQAKTVKAEKTAKFKQGYGGKQQMTRSLLKTHMTALIKGLEKDHKLPVVCFTLSRRRCDSNAELLSSLDLTTRMEKDEISDFFRRCTAPRLRGTDQNLAQVVQLKDLLVRGVGVHHSGILPLLKEVVEMLFQRGLVKLLFATETFAMGVNMPTRTVIFENISKHDGRNYRTLLASEYIQMAGRAGRRGIDTTGTVIILGIADLPDLEELQKMMLGKATDLDSQFRLTYNMILNLLRSTNKKLSMEQMMRESFLEHSNQSDLSDSQKKLEGLKQQEREEGQLDCPRCMPKLEEFLVKFQQAIELRETFFSTFSPAHLKPYLRPGRIMILSTPYHPKVPALLLAANGLLLKLIVRRPKNSAEQEPYPRWTKLLYNPSEQESEFHYLPDFPVSKLAGISTKEIKSNMMGDILSICDQGLMKKKLAFNPTLAQFATAVSSHHGLHTVKDFKNMSLDQIIKLSDLSKLEDELEWFSCFGCPLITEHCKQVTRRLDLLAQIEELAYKISMESLQYGREFKERREILRKLHYITPTDFVDKKGVVAREMSTHELVLTELIFEDVLTQLPPEEIAALLSCLVCKQDLDKESKLPENLEKILERFKEVAHNIARVQKECGLEETEEDFMAQFKTGLLPVVYDWAKGMPFSHIAQMTAIQEGIIVHSLQRLNEILKNIQTAAHLIGSLELREKVKTASNLIHRGIVVTSSLYLLKL